MSWSGIEAWARANGAPLAEPSTAADIAAAEEVLGQALPADLAAWWLRFGGIDDRTQRWELIAPSWHLYSLREALADRVLMIDAIRGIAFSSPEEEAEFEASALQEPAGSPCSEVWLPAWLPIASDGCGRLLFVDLRGGPSHGCVMEWDKYGGAESEPLWPNVTEMFAYALRTLEGGEEKHRAVLDEGLYWEST